MARASSGSPQYIWAPGRINVLGEHTDTSEGFCLPAAVDRGLLCAFAPSPDTKSRVSSLEVEGQVELRHGWHLSSPAPSFGAYVEAVAHVLKARGVEPPPLTLALGSTIPAGGGMSSSAALCVALALALSSACEAPLSNLDLALVAQAAEHRVGVNCGLMDQYAIVHGQSGCGLLLDTREKSHQIVPLDLDGWAFVVGDTGKSRGLVDSEYNARRAQVEEAARILDGGSGTISCLRDATADLVEASRTALGPLLYRRARHVIEENARTQKAALLLSDKSAPRDPSALAQKLGQLLNDSHASLRDQFEVSCAELDALVSALQEQGDDQVAGARMMGGGFGGCVIALVAQGAIEETLSASALSYRTETGRDAAFFPVEISSGARPVSANFGSVTA